MLNRDTITIRGAFRYHSRDALEDAMWAMRMLLDRGQVPLRFRCWITARNTLSIDLSVPMFADHDIGPRLCEVLGTTATAARCVVRAKLRFAEGTGVTHVRKRSAPDISRVLEELTLTA